VPGLDEPVSVLALGAPAAPPEPPAVAIETPEVSVIVLAYRSTGSLDACLRSLRTHVTKTSFEVLVVANGVTSDVAEVVAQHPWVRCVSSRSNRGFAGGCNLGARHARGRRLLFLNDDAIVEVGWLDGLLHVLDTHEGVGVVGSVLCDRAGSVLEFGGRTWGTTPEALDRGATLHQTKVAGARVVEYTPGCSLLIDRQLFDRVEGFDESFYPAYFEDIDLCRRVWATGHSVVVTPASVVTHVEAESTSPILREVIFERGRKRFEEKWGRKASPAPSGLPRTAPKVVYFDDFLPRPASGSGLSRTRELIEVLTALGYYVQMVVWGDNFDLDSDLAARGVTRVLFDEELDVGDDPAAVIVARPNNFEHAADVAARWPGVPLIYDAEARFAARYETKRQVDRFAADADVLAAEQHRLEAVETSIATRADALVTISEEEAAWFRGRGAASVTVREPFPAPCEPGAQGFAERRDAIYVAGWLAGPGSANDDGLRWLVDEVLPLVKAEAPELTILVTGAGPPRELLELRSEQLRFIGEVPDLGASLDQVRVAVVPIRFGAGVKIKTVDALSRGLPVVVTSLGAEGIAPSWREAMRIEDDPALFARALIEVSTEEASWSPLREAALASCAAHDDDPRALWEMVLAQATVRAAERTRR
jgi:GT2 family glycosyltransferase